MAEQDPSRLSGLPQWPADAKELPGGKPPKQSFRWLYRAGAIGAGLGLLRALPILLQGSNATAEQLGYATGSVLFPGFLGVAVGYLLDRQRWAREHRQWERGID
jgi:hypothetical protein